MSIRDGHTCSPRHGEMLGIVVGWGATAAATAFNPVWYVKPSDSLWDAVAMAAAALAVSIAVASIDIARMWRSGACAHVKGGNRIGLVFGLAAWIWGGFFDLVVSNIVFLGPSGLRDFLGALAAISATPALIVIAVVGRRSRTASWLSAAIVTGFYLLAICLWGVHFSGAFEFPLQS